MDWPVCILDLLCYGQGEARCDLMSLMTSDGRLSAALQPWQMFFACTSGSTYCRCSRCVRARSQRGKACTRRLVAAWVQAPTWPPLQKIPKSVDSLAFHQTLAQHGLDSVITHAVAAQHALVRLWSGGMQACMALPDSPAEVGNLDADTGISHGTFQAALVAAGAVCRAIDVVLTGQVSLHFSLCETYGRM